MKKLTAILVTAILVTISFGAIASEKESGKPYMGIGTANISADRVKFGATYSLIGGFAITNNLSVEGAWYSPAEFRTGDVKGKFQATLYTFRYNIDIPVFDKLKFVTELGRMDLKVYDAFETTPGDPSEKLDDQKTSGQYYGFGWTYDGAGITFRKSDDIKMISADVTVTF